MVSSIPPAPTEAVYLYHSRNPAVPHSKPHVELNPNTALQRALLECTRLAPQTIPLPLSNLVKEQILLRDRAARVQVPPRDAAEERDPKRAKH
jgi:hypothetical protein